MKKQMVDNILEYKYGQFKLIVTTTFGKSMGLLNSIWIKISNQKLDIFISII